MAGDRQEIRYRLADLPISTRENRRRPQTNSASKTAPPQLPRITRLMALAIKLEQLMREHPDLSYQELARLGRVSASRITQVLNLLHLAPDLQQRLLWLEPTRKGRERVHERALRTLSRIYDWQLQRLEFESIVNGNRIEGEGRRND